MPFSALQKEFMFEKIIRSVLVLLVLTVSLSGCLPARVPAGADYVDGTVVTTLSGNVSLSYASLDKSISGSGFLMYRKPEQIRVVILSPFGSVLQEIYISGELITIIDSGNGIAFSGTQSDLPVKGDFSCWRYIHWLIDFDPPDPSRRTVTVQRINSFGAPEQADYKNGLLVSKRSAEAGLVSYGGYGNVQGAPFPFKISYEAASGEIFTMAIEEPEINVPFAASAFTPDLSKLRVYPLSALK